MDKSNPNEKIPEAIRAAKELIQFFKKYNLTGYYDVQYSLLIGLLERGDLKEAWELSGKLTRVGPGTMEDLPLNDNQFEELGVLKNRLSQLIVDIIIENKISV